MLPPGAGRTSLASASRIVSRKGLCVSSLCPEIPHVPAPHLGFSDLCCKNLCCASRFCTGGKELGAANPREVAARAMTANASSGAQSEVPERSSGGGASPAHWTRKTGRISTYLINPSGLSRIQTPEFPGEGVNLCED